MYIVGKGFLGTTGQDELDKVCVNPEALLAEKQRQEKCIVLQHSADYL